MNTNTAVLGIYLNDHLAGATMGVELFHRASGSAQGSVKTQLQELTTQVERDRESLLTLMGTLGVPVRRYKVLGGWVLEKAGRIKANGRVLRRSPLSDLIELEGLVLGVQGKAAGFRALRRLADTDPRLEAPNIDRLIERAEQQADTWNSYEYPPQPEYSPPAEPAGCPAPPPGIKAGRGPGEAFRGGAGSQEIS
jgi:hypothetical protein